MQTEETRINELRKGLLIKVDGYLQRIGFYGRCLANLNVETVESANDSVVNIGVEDSRRNGKVLVIRYRSTPRNIPSVGLRYKHCKDGNVMSIAVGSGKAGEENLLYDSSSKLVQAIVKRIVSPTEEGAWNAELKDFAIVKDLLEGKVKSIDARVQEVLAELEPQRWSCTTRAR